MERIAVEAAAFASLQAERQRHARQLAAVSLGCGIDLPAVLELPGKSRAQTIRRVRRILERERLKGGAGHPGYSLERHIALGESLVRLENGHGKKENGARRRRREC